MKKFLTALLALLPCLAFAVEYQDLRSRAGLMNQLLLETEGGEISLQVEGNLLMTNQHVVSQVSQSITFPSLKKAELMLQTMQQLNLSYEVRSDIPIGTEAVIRQTWYDQNGRTTFEGYDYDKFVLNENSGRRELATPNPRKMGISIASNIYVEYDSNEDVLEATLIKSWGGIIDLQVEDEGFYFPAGYVGEEGSLVIREEKNGREFVTVIDVRKGEIVSTQELSLTLQRSSLFDLYEVYANGNGVTSITPWFYYQDQVFEFTGIPQLNVEAFGWYGEIKPYLMVIQNVTTGQQMEIPSTCPGLYAFNASHTYRVWFDWEAIFPEVEVTSIVDNKIYIPIGNGEEKIDHRVLYKIDVTAKSADAFIPLDSFEPEIRALYQWDEVNHPTLVSSVTTNDGSLSWYRGRYGVWVRQGETVEFTVTVEATTDGFVGNIFELSVPSLDALLQDGTTSQRVIKGTEQQLQFRNGKG